MRVRGDNGRNVVVTTQKRTIEPINVNSINENIYFNLLSFFSGSDFQTTISFVRNVFYI